jgi:hypothetical protein
LFNAGTPKLFHHSAKQAGSTVFEKKFKKIKPDRTTARKWLQ